MTTNESDVSESKQQLNGSEAAPKQRSFFQKRSESLDSHGFPMVPIRRTDISARERHHEDHDLVWMQFALFPSGYFMIMYYWVLLHYVPHLFLEFLSSCNQLLYLFV